MRPLRGHRKSAQAGTQEVIASPHPILLARKLRPVAVISTSFLPRVNQLAPCLVLCSERLSHYLGIYVSVTLKDNCPCYHWGEPGQPWSPTVAGGGAILLGAGWGFNFRGICNGWGAALGTWWLWAILGGKRLARGGREYSGLIQAISESALSVGRERTHDGKGRPTREWGLSHLIGTQGPRITLPPHASPGYEKSRSCCLVRSLWLFA